MRVAVLGVGLIGGSVGLASTERLGASVTGWDPSPQALDTASALGAISHRAGSIAEAVTAADVVVCAAPVGALPDLVAAALDAAPSGCVVTDVGSTKRALVTAIDDPRFVGGHPLAGAETGGVAGARADLFDGATWYLSPRDGGAPDDRIVALVCGVGARPVEIDPGEHDRLMAAVSHLPHVLANVVVARAAAAAPDAGAGGPSLRDAIRVAGAPSAIWTDIYLSNRTALLGEIDGAIDRLRAVRELFAAGDASAIAAWNDDAAADRRALLAPDGDA